ncbi:unnamed protein product, partial [marine sediment metagenome]
MIWVLIILGIGLIIYLSGCKKPDGSKMYLLGTDSNTVYQYSLSTPWDVSTAVYEGKFKCVIPEETTPKDLAFKEDVEEISDPDKSIDISSEDISPYNVRFR